MPREDFYGRFCLAEGRVRHPGVPPLPQASGDSAFSPRTHRGVSALQHRPLQLALRAELILAQHLPWPFRGVGVGGNSDEDELARKRESKRPHPLGQGRVGTAGGSQLKDTIQLAAGDSAYDTARSFRRCPEVANRALLERRRNHSSSLDKPGGARHKYALLG